MNRLRFSQRSIPLLKAAVETAKDKEARDRASFALFESLLDAGEWQTAEHIFAEVSHQISLRAMQKEMPASHAPARALKLLAPSDLWIRDIEQLSFDDAYQLWRQEKDSIASNRSRDGSYSIPAGATDAQTGEFRPSRISVLECRLGREAHLHEEFLRGQLAKDAEVHRILEASPRLCEQCGIGSKAQVVFLAEGHYCYRTTDGWSPQIQQRLWLEALKRTSSRPAGAANGSGRDGP